MPKFDKTGPQGNGPMTGRGLGSCQDGGFFGGCRRMGRRCFGRRFFSFGQSIVDTESEKECLVEEAKILEEELKAIKDRLTEIETK